MAKQRRKRKRKTNATQASSAPAQSGGVMQSIRSGFRRATGVEQSAKPSRAGNIVWTIILLAAVAVLLYRWYG